MPLLHLLCESVEVTFGVHHVFQGPEASWVPGSNIVLSVKRGFLGETLMVEWGLSLIAVRSSTHSDLPSHPSTAPILNVRHHF